MDYLKVEFECKSLGYSLDNKCFMAEVQTKSFNSNIFLIDFSDVNGLWDRFFTKEDNFKCVGLLDMSNTQKIKLIEAHKIIKNNVNGNGLFSYDYVKKILNDTPNTCIIDNYFYDSVRKECLPFEIESGK